MKRITILAACLLVLAACNNTKDVEPVNARIAVAPYGTYSEGLLGSVEPQGWLREFLDRQVSGITGHPDALAYPYTTCLWNGEITREGKNGSGWWRYEQTGYYSDGLLRLGYAVADTALIHKGEGCVEYTLAHVTPEGVLGVHDPYMLEGDLYSQWPQAVFFRTMQAMYQGTGDERIPAALEKHYLALAPEAYHSRSAINTEGILWAYELSGNEALLDLAKKVWENGEFYTNEAECMADDTLNIHGVTLCEELKIPMLLYACTGEQRYLDAAVKMEKKMEDQAMLPDGVPSSAEYLCGKNPNHSHETCDITDFTWTMGYYLMTTGDPCWADRIEKAVFNAGLGCVTKDFRSLQYFSSPNQFIATGTSNNNAFKYGSTWMAYRPTHETECCAGNVHRFMPNYVARMWLRGRGDEIVSALYGPSKVNFALEDGTVCTITEDTEYPFSDDIRFVFNFRKDGRKVRSHALKFSYRIPEGCTLNGKSDEGSYISEEREFRNGETLSLHFQAEPMFKEAEGGMYAQRGELVYAYAIPADMQVDTTTYSNMNHKAPEAPGFPCWSITPAGDWNWALDTSAGLNWKETKAKPGSYPWDNAPVSMSVKASKVAGWELVDGRFTPDIPAEFSTEGTEQEITLVPYGCTTLRLTVFPVQK